MTPEPCWACGGDYAPFCHGDPPTEIPGQANLLDEIEDDT